MAYFPLVQQAKQDQSSLMSNSTDTEERQSKRREGQKNWQQERENEKKVCERSCLFMAAQMFL